VPVLTDVHTELDVKPVTEVVDVATVTDLPGSITMSGDGDEVTISRAGSSFVVAAAGISLDQRVSVKVENATVDELLRELLERQALRRIDAGSLREGEIERMGETFLRLAEEIEKLKEYFGFTDEDLNLSLGPLGKLR